MFSDAEPGDIILDAAARGVYSANCSRAAQAGSCEQPSEVRHCHLLISVTPKLKISLGRCQHPFPVSVGDRVDKPVLD